MCGRYYAYEGTSREIENLVSKIDSHLYGTADCKTADHGTTSHKTTDAITAEITTAGKRDVFPSQDAPVLIRDAGGGIVLASMRWGFPAKNRKLLINARAETVHKLPTFAESIQSRRCVIIAGGFYEWNAEKEKAAFFMPDTHLLLFAGCYNLTENRRSFVILTTAANDSVRPVHDRMPLLLGPEDLTDWFADGPAYKKLLGLTPPPLSKKQEYEQQSLF